MSMSVSFGTCSDDPRVINKNPSLTNTKEAEVWGDCSRSTPTFLLDYDASLLTANYAYVKEFGRYYWVRDVVVQSGKRMLVYLTVDPLKSFENEIRDADYLIIKSEAEVNRWIADPTLPVFPGFHSDVYEFPNDLYQEGALNTILIEVMGSETSHSP